MLPTFDLLCGDAHEVLCALPPRIVQCCVTSVPYWMLRDYQVEGQLGLEPLHEYVEKLARVFDEVRRVLTDDGVCWLNIGDSYIGSGKGATGSTSTLTNPKRHDECGFPKSRTRITEGLKLKDLAMVPARVALELQRRGWWLRDDVVWHKTNPMPEPVIDRPTRSHEYVYLLSKSASYYYDVEAVKQPTSGGAHARRSWREKAGFKSSPAMAQYSAQAQPEARVMTEAERAKAELVKGRRREGAEPVGDLVETRNLRDVWKLEEEYLLNPWSEGVWDIATVPSGEDHFAMFPPELPRRCIRAASRPGDLVLDCFSGMATTGLVALEQGRSYLGIDLDVRCITRSRERLSAVTPAHPLLLGGVG